MDYSIYTHCVHLCLTLVFFIVKLFARIFPDSEVAKKFSWGRTKTSAIIEEVLAPCFILEFIEYLKDNTLISLMLDVSNDKTDKSCIILVRSLDHRVGDVQTRFIDMPVVNVGNTKKKTTFSAVILSLTSKGLSLGNCVAFMSDTTMLRRGQGQES